MMFCKGAFFGIVEYAIVKILEVYENKKVCETEKRNLGVAAKLIRPGCLNVF